MKGRNSSTTPVLFFNTGRESKEACDSVMASRIRCEFVGSVSEHDAPLLVWSDQKYEGAKEINRFLENRKKLFLK